MRKFLLAILLTLSTFAVVAHGILVYQLSRTEYIIAEEEHSDEKPSAKEAKDLHKETVSYHLSLCQDAAADTSFKAALKKKYHCSKGFSNKPFNPPDKA